MRPVPSSFDCLHCFSHVQQQWQGIVDDEVDTDFFLMFFESIKLGVMQL
jgi:hypothetical protein